MSKYLLLILLAAMLALIGCQTSSGSREYVPGKGWILND